jgi:hypothetical protein
MANPELSSEIMALRLAFRGLQLCHVIVNQDLICQGIRGSRPLMLTARQYGEVVLPDASTGQSPGTPRQRGQKFVTVQGGYGAVFAIQVQSLLSLRVSRYKV